MRLKCEYGSENLCLFFFWRTSSGSFRKEQEEAYLLFKISALRLFEQSVLPTEDIVWRR